MKVLGVEFAPLHISRERRLQTVAAAAWFTFLAFGMFLGPIITICLLFTRFWWLVLLYVFWTYLDKETSETGGRPIASVQKWAWWSYVKQYFPCNMVLVPGFTLDEKKNYLFACFPHGVLPAGPFTNLQCHCGEFNKLYPNFSVRTVILSQQLYSPFLRELGHSVGCVSSSAKSLNWVLSRPEGAHIAILMPGGALEAYNSYPGKYKFVLNNRKGFVKIALKNGSPLVPVISFGESDMFDQIEGPKLRRIQEVIRKNIGLAPVIFNGRGFFQYNFGLLPRRTPITTVVGKPIDVTKVENPTNEQVDELHKKFKEELQNLFEEYKYKYLEDPENKTLELQ